MLEVLFWDGQVVFSSHSDFAGMCVAAATLLEYLLAGQKTLEQTGIILGYIAKMLRP
jgi:hypothetical protein